MDAEPDESPENSYAAVRALFLKNAFKTARREHNFFCESKGERGAHFKMCDTYCMHHEVAGAEDKLFASFSSIWQLLGIGRQMNSKWAAVLHCDASFNFCRADMALVTIGINTLGGHYRNLITSIVGGGKETKQGYSVTYNAMRSGFHLVCSLPA